MFCWQFVDRLDGVGPGGIPFRPASNLKVTGQEICEFPTLGVAPQILPPQSLMPLFLMIA